MASGAHDRLRELREPGADPAHGGEAARKRGSQNRRHQSAVYEWIGEYEGQADHAFNEEILLPLQDVLLSVLAEAIELSKGYCSFVKSRPQ